MFGGFGSIDNMIVTLRNNRNLLPTKRSYFKNKDYGTIKKEYYKAAGGSFNVKKASPEQLLFLRNKIIKTRKKEALRFTFLLFIGLPLIALGLYFTFHNFSFGFSNSEAQITKVNIEKSNEEMYLFYIDDGDKWLSKRNYYNAVFQYKKALQLFPNDFDANYRLALAYSYRCQYDFEDCGIGMQLTNKLEEQFPSNQEIQSIKAVFINWGE